MMTISHTRFLMLMLVLMMLFAPVQAQANSLDNAKAAIFAGDYDKALADYTSAASDPALQCDALFGLGSTYMRVQRLDEADAALTQHISICGETVRGLVMRGHIREQAGRSQEALIDYQQALTLTPNPLQSYLYERIAAIDADNGMRALRLATEADRVPDSKFTLRQKLADAYLLLGNSALALAQYDALLADMNAYITTLQALDVKYDAQGTRRAELEFKAATLEIGAEQFDRGYARLQRLIATYPETPFAFDALVKLITSGQAVDIVLRVRINILNENYNPVLGVLPDYLAAASNPPAELYLLLAMAQHGTGDPDVALKTLATLQALYPQDVMVSRAGLEIAKTYLSTKNYVQAIQAFLNVAAASPQSPEAPEALLQAAQTARDFIDVEQSLAIYDQLGAQYSTSPQAQRGLFDAGMLVRQSDPQRAAAFLGRVGTAEGFLWQGKLLNTINPAAAQQAWTQAAAVQPGTYFGMRACALLNNFDPFAQSGPIQPMTITAEDKTAAAQWVAQTFGLAGVSAEIAPELASDPMLIRAQALWEVGLWTEARLEFDTIHRLHRNDPLGLLQLAFYYQSLGLYRSSLFAALRLMALSKAAETTIPSALVRLAYPIEYEAVVVQEANKYGLDPLLVAGLIRQESSFDATNFSAADARGLMQLIPSTAADVANRLGWPNYTVKDLFKPSVNIAFGSYYLALVRDIQGGSIAAALLSYNAGPTAVQGWLNASGRDMDQLHRVIQYDETRQYLEFIYQNAIIYQQFYRAPVPACMFGAAPAAN